MRDANIETIRKACIAANPICTCTLPHCFKEARRPIRLADVLLALRNRKDGPIAVSINGDFLDCDDDMNNLQVMPHAWNLRTDYLTQQSDETIKFLADLLSGNHS